MIAKTIKRAVVSVVGEKRLRALTAAVDEYDNAMYFGDWDQRRGIFAADDLFDQAYNERPDDRAQIAGALDVIRLMLNELNDHEETT